MQTVNASITLASNNFKEINCCSNLSTLDLDKNSKWLFAIFVDERNYLKYNEDKISAKMCSVVLGKSNQNKLLLKKASNLKSPDGVYNPKVLSTWP